MAGGRAAALRGAACDRGGGVVRPGGVVGINDWTGEGFFGAMEELYANLGLYTGSTGFHPSWGQEDFARAEMAPFAHHIEVRQQLIAARFEKRAQSACAMRRSRTRESADTRYARPPIHEATASMCNAPAAIRTVRFSIRPAA